ncbi:probable RNA-dependent RNA polymerase 5 [Daucus carota subsp. sativus]|uniref:probable RNA-dependent RNA polymerase 5 n=1 Tax=Daucus carota subsp. sativus TaxID=79200 RepID=UPI0007EF030F|nr:PREDICTED: probable RNA-dependent RNA polymerase 5 [Daucus carota subsp. sativus]
MEESEVELPMRVDRMVQKICFHQCLPPLDTESRKILACIGEDNSMHMLKIISQARIKTFSGFINHLAQNYKPQSLSQSINSPAATDDFVVRSPFPEHLLRSPSSDSEARTPLAMSGSSSSSNVQRTCTPGAEHLLTSPCSSSGNSYTPPRKKLEFSSPIDTNQGSTSTISKQWRLLFQLEFRRIFLLLNYIGRKKLEDLVSVEDAYQILEMKDEPMEKFESYVWNKYGCLLVGNELPDRRRHTNWESGKTHHYYCHVFQDGSLSFQGPYLNTTETLLHRTLGDENVLIVRFEEQRGVSTYSPGNHKALYHKIARKGILIGQRRYRFFVFKVGERKGKKSYPITSDVNCYFVRMELIAPCGEKKPYILLNKTMHQARCLFMHLHTTPNLAKYASRCSLVLSQTTRLDVDLDSVHIEEIEDIPCRNENGFSVCNEDGDLLIHTDGTGFISEDLAMLCPNANYISKKKSKMEDGTFEGLIDAYVNEPPLLIQCRLFHKGRAVKGTLLLNKKLPPQTIQIRPSMIKVEVDPTWKGVPSVNSLEVVNISRKPGTSRLSKLLIPLLNIGGVPDQFFLHTLAVALEDTQRLFYNKRSAVKASMNLGTLDDDATTAKIILSGVPLNEACVQSRLSKLAMEERKGLRKGKLPISESFLLMGTADPTGLLNSDQVCIILENGQISGKVLVYRHPGLHFGDIHVMNAVYLEEMENVVGDAKYGILFSTKGPRSVASEIANGDFDGDMYWVSKNKQLLQHYKQSAPWKREHPSSLPKNPKEPPRRPCDFTSDELEHELFELFLNSKNQNITMGIAANSWQAWTDKFLTASDDDEKKYLKEKMLKLIDLYYDALDAPKSGEEVMIPRELIAGSFPHYMEQSKEYHSCSVLGQICAAVEKFRSKSMSRCEIRKLPLFEQVSIPAASLKLWKERYDNYREDMTDALSSNSQSERNLAGDVINKYKEILYGTVDFKATTRNMNDINEDALALYNVCYDFAKSKGDVAKCNFVWKVAGPALCQIYTTKALNSERSMFYGLPSVLAEILN